VYIASVTQAETLSQAEPLTYAEYLSSVKPKKAETEKKKGYVCKICGYVYEGEELPEDFVCPWCKHGADAFEPIS
ncbi:MAG: flavodoxin, partial [Clostridia bacterium]|nr:flavodoxin [Clostridia bacterium]